MKCRLILEEERRSIKAIDREYPNILTTYSTMILRDSLRGSLFAGLLASDLSTIDPTRRIANGLRCNLTPPKRHWHPRLCARAFLASPWANGSMSVCLGSSAAGGPASESGTSFTAHASAHDPKVSLFSFVSARWAQGEFGFFRGRGCQQ